MITWCSERALKQVFAARSGAIDCIVRACWFAYLID